MTLEELKTLKPGEVVVITKIDGYINNETTSKDYYVGEEMTFWSLDTWFNFYRPYRDSIGRISHFGPGVCDYIERKVQLVRNNKLNKLGI